MAVLPSLGAVESVVRRPESVSGTRAQAEMTMQTIGKKAGAVLASHGMRLKRVPGSSTRATHALSLIHI